MANKGTAGTSISILPDEVKSRFSGSLDYSPGANEYWYYKTVTVTSSPISPILTTDEYFQNERASDSIANDDIVRWIGIKHSGTTNGSSSTNEAVMLNTFGVNPVWNAGSKLTVSAATAATPTVLTAAGHSFSNGDVVRLSDMDEATELNGMMGIVESTNTSNGTFQVDGVYVDTTAESTGGSVAHAGVGAIIGPNDLYVSKLNGVTVGDLKMATAILTSGVPTAAGTNSAYIYVAAIIKDVA